MTATAEPGERLIDPTAPPIAEAQPADDDFVDAWVHPETGQVIVPQLVETTAPPPRSSVKVSYEIDEQGGPFNLTIDAPHHGAGLRHAASTVEGIVRAICYPSQEDNYGADGVHADEHNYGAAQHAAPGTYAQASDESQTVRTGDLMEPNLEDKSFMASAWARGRERRKYSQEHGRFLSRHPVLRNKLIGALTVTVLFPFAVDLGMDIERNFWPPTNVLSPSSLIEVHPSDWSPLRAINLFRKQ